MQEDVHMTFKSKVDAWLGTTLVIAIFAQLGAAAGLVASRSLAALVGAPVLLIGAVFLLWILGTTYYIVSEAEVLIRCGPFKIRIPIDQITKIERTRNPLSSPALSLDRIAISYGSSGYCMVSPKDSDGFLSELRVRGARVA
jgi:hypothetical protein